MRAEPRTRVVAIGIDDEAGVRLERGGGPLPDVAEHLAATERAVAVGQRSDVDAAERAAIEVRARRPTRRIGWTVAPRVAPLARRQRAGAIGLGGGGHLPFGLGRQATPG